MRKLLALAFGGLLLLGPHTLWSASFQTNLVFQTPLANPGVIDTIQLNWATNVGSGAISRADVTDLTMTLLTGGIPALTDMVVVGGVVQPIGGAARILDDILFDFDLNTSTLGQVRNVLSATLAGSTGIQVRVSSNAGLTVDGQVILDIFSDGTSLAVTTDLLASQSTSLVGGGVIPEPGTASSMILALGSAIVWGRFRRRTL